MNYLLFSFLKTLYFCYKSMVFLSIYNILYTIGKLWFPSFQWDGCPSEITTYLATRHFLLSLLSIQISHSFPMQVVSYHLRFMSLRRNVTYLGSPKLGRLYRYVKSLPTFCFPYIFSSTSPSTYFAVSLYHTKFAPFNGAKSFICYIGK